MSFLVSREGIYNSSVKINSFHSISRQFVYMQYICAVMTFIGCFFYGFITSISANSVQTEILEWLVWWWGDAGDCGSVSLPGFPAFHTLQLLKKRKVIYSSLKKLCSLLIKKMGVSEGDSGHCDSVSL